MKNTYIFSHGSWIIGFQRRLRLIIMHRVRTSEIACFVLRLAELMPSWSLRVMVPPYPSAVPEGKFYLV